MTRNPRVTRVTRVTLLALLALTPALAAAGTPPFMPSFLPKAQVSTQQMRLPNMYRLSPIPPLMPLIVENQVKLGISPAQMKALMAAVKGNQSLITGALATNRALHEDILNGVTGLSLGEAVKAVRRSQETLLVRSVAVDEKALGLLTPKQRGQVVARYRQLENAPQGGAPGGL